ncbi:MAG: murein biosynthesis integral membrane protein MurJ [Clostridia bacterium]|nr:murein biosynthesis integral membrane protein MurJ [Clostridia bacterium]
MKKKGQGATYFIILGCILLTKVLGMLRNSFLADAYGTGMEAKVFQAVSKLPLTLYDVTLGTAIVSAFIPVFNGFYTTEGKKTAERFAGNFMTIAGTFSALVCAVGMIFPEPFVRIVASEFSAEEMTLALGMMRSILPVMLFATLTYIFIGVLQSYGEFTAPSLVSLFTNLAIIVYFMVFDRWFGIEGLAVAFTIGWVLQLLFLLPFTFKKKFRYYPSFSFNADMRRVLLLTLPLFVTSLAQPINTIISSRLSSGMEGGAMSVLGYAYDAYFILAAVFASAMTNLYFPELSRRFAAGDTSGTADIGGKMLRTVAVIVLPISVFMITCGEPIIRILYQRGDFTAADTAAVAFSLAIYCVGMLALSFQEILNKYFYSMQKPQYPMLAALGGILLNLGLSYWFVSAFGDYRLLALATVISGWFMAILLMVIARVKVKALICGRLFLSLGKTLLAALLCGAAAGGVRMFTDGEGFVRSAVCVLTSFAAGAVVYFAALKLMKSEEITELLSRKKGGSNEI